MPASITEPSTPSVKPVVRIFNPGPFQTNCHVVSVAGHGGCWIVDAGFEAEEMIDAIRRSGLVPEALIFTHAHLDHIAGGHAVIAAFPGLPIWIHEAEADWLPDAERNMSAMFGLPVTAPGPDRLLRDGDTLKLGPTSWRVLHTPGHSPGGISLLCENAPLAIVGDSLFAGSIGRTDFPGCSFEDLAHSIRSKLYTLPDSVVIYPGHGPSSTIGREKRSNPFVRP